MTLLGWVQYMAESVKLEGNVELGMVNPKATPAHPLYQIYRGTLL